MPTARNPTFSNVTGLELVNLVLGVAQLVQRARQLALVLGTDLGTTDSLVHAGRATDKQLDVLLLGLREDSLEEVLGDVALAAVPALGGIFEDVESLEALGVGVLEILELPLQEDVVLGDVAVHQSHLGLVIGVLEDLADQLVHGRDSGAAGDQADLVVLVGLPGVLGKRALE